MIGGRAWRCSALAAALLAFGAAPAWAQVRLLVPTQPEVSELAVLTRAELATARVAVEHRTIPTAADFDQAWLASARRDGARAVVMLESAAGRLGARVFLLGPGTLEAHEEREPDGRTAGAVARGRATLAIRIAERIREHLARPGPPPAIVAAAIASWHLDGLLLGGRSLHPGAPALGLELAIARIASAGWLVRASLAARTPAVALRAAAGTARPFEATALVAAGYQGAARWRPAVALGMGAQQTLLVGHAARGFEARRESMLSFALAASAGLAPPITPRLALLASLRGLALFPRPLVLIDDAAVSDDLPTLEATLGLRFAL